MLRASDGLRKGQEEANVALQCVIVFARAVGGDRLKVIENFFEFVDHTDVQIFHGKVLARSQSPGYIAGFQCFVIGSLDGIETLAGFDQSINIDADAVCGVVRLNRS